MRPFRLDNSGLDAAASESFSLSTPHLSILFQVAARVSMQRNSCLEESDGADNRSLVPSYKPSSAL